MFGHFPKACKLCNRNPKCRLRENGRDEITSILPEVVSAWKETVINSNKPPQLLQGGSGFPCVEVKIAIIGETNRNLDGNTLIITSGG